MMIKLGIIVGLAVLGGMVFYTEIDAFFPNTVSTVPDSLKADVEKLGSEATDFVSERLDESTVQLEQMAGDATGSIIDNIQDTQESLMSKTSELNPLKSLQEEE